MSSAIAALIAHASFWVLLGYAWFWDELGHVGVAVFLALWTAGYIGLPYLPNGDGLFFSYVAVLDIVLVFVIFKGDINLT